MNNSEAGLVSLDTWSSTPFVSFAKVSESAREPFDRICRVTRRLLAVETAVVTLVDSEKQALLGRAGVPARLLGDSMSPLSHTFSKYVVASGQTLVVEDARVSPLLGTSPPTQERGFVSYAGAPLGLSSGSRVAGTLCVVDPVPRGWTMAEVEQLKELAEMAADEIELQIRLNAFELVESVAQRLPEPLEKLGALVRSAALMGEDPQDPRLPRTLDLARSRLELVETLTDDLRHAFATRQEAVQQSPVDLRSRVAQALELVSTSHRTSDVRGEVVAGPLFVECEASVLERFLTYLLATSMVHVVDGRTLQVDLRVEGSQGVLTVSVPGHAMPVGEMLRIVGLLGAGQEGAVVEVGYDAGAARVRNRWTTACARPDGTTFEVRLDVVPQPVAQQPLAHQPVAHQPVAHQPVAHQPVAHQPVVHQPVAQPLVAQPLVAQPLVAQPVVPGAGRVPAPPQAPL